MANQRMWDYPQNKTNMNNIEWLKDFPVALRFIRNARQMTLRDIEKETGVSRTTIWRIETKETNFSFETAFKLINWMVKGKP